MKSAVIALALMATSTVFAQQNCYSIKDELDQKYCMDKYLQSVKTKHAAEKKSWGKALNGDDKADKAEAIEAEIASKKAQAAMVQSEIGLLESHLAALNAVKESAPAKKPKKKKKEKKKNPFGIKL